MNEIKEYNKNIFESIRHIDEDGLEYWEARELQKVLIILNGEDLPTPEKSISDLHLEKLEGLQNKTGILN